MNPSYNKNICTVSEKEADPLEAIVRRGAKLLLEAALETEVTEYLERTRHQRATEEKEFRGYRNGYAKERKLTVGSGTIKVTVPRVSDVPETQESFESRIVKPYQRRSDTLAAVFPKLFIEGLATRDFEPSLRCLMGAEAALSPSTISRLNQRFKQEYEDWTKSSLSSLPIVYLWVDGIYVTAGVGDEKACLLVVIGADTAGQKHLLALEEGYRESKESWLSVLRGLKARGMNEPSLATGDGALGFWSAAGELWRFTKQQRCWVHKQEKRVGQVAATREKRSGPEPAGDLFIKDQRRSQAEDAHTGQELERVV
jgi:transposase-like protein